MCSHRSLVNDVVKRIDERHARNHPADVYLRQRLNDCQVTCMACHSVNEATHGSFAPCDQESSTVQSFESAIPSPTLPPWTNLEISHSGTTLSHDEVGRGAIQSRWRGMVVC